jgi:serine/threonine-protein kinase
MYWGPVPFNRMATVWVLLGEYERAIDVLEALMGMEYLPALTVADLRLDPTWDPLRDHPRFQALLERYRDDVEH